MDEQAFLFEITPADASHLEVLEHSLIPMISQNHMPGAMRSSSEGRESLSSPGMSTPRLLTSCYLGAVLMMLRSGTPWM